MNLPVEVIEAIEQGRCVLIAGSRFSAEAGEAADSEYPEAKELALSLGWKRKKHMMGTVKSRKVLSAPSVLEGAGLYEKRNGREALVAEMKSRLGLSEVKGTDAHRVAVDRFPLIVTTNYDSLLERAAAAAETGHSVRYRGEDLPDPSSSESVIFKLRGGFEREADLVLTHRDREVRALDEANRKQLKKILRKQVILFVGYKPDEEEFEVLWEDLTVSYGGELPRCHMAVAQGRINDYLWQKWVWRGLLMFTADPVECMLEVEQRTK